MSVSVLPCLAEDGVGQLVADLGGERVRLTMTLYDDGPASEPQLSIEVSLTDLLSWCALITDPAPVGGSR